MASYQRLKIYIATALALYVLVAVSGNLFSPRKEYFPAFSWSLFSDVPGIKSTYELLIHRVDDVVFDQPVKFFDLHDYFAGARRRAPGVAKSVKALGRALNAGSDTVAAKRAVFEDLILENHSRVDYEITKVRFWPLERWRSNQLITERSFGTFVAEVEP